jgi:hypothetical protein
VLQNPVALKVMGFFFVLNLTSRLSGGTDTSHKCNCGDISAFYAVRFRLNSQNTSYIGHFGLRYDPEVVAFSEFLEKFAF